MAMNSCRFGHSAAIQLLKQPEQDRIDPIEQGPEPALAGNAVMIVREMPQEDEMVFAPGDNVVEIVAGGDRGALPRAHAD